MSKYEEEEEEEEEANESHIKHTAKPNLNETDRNEKKVNEQN